MKKIIIIFICLISIFMLNGCSYKELNDLAIASALGIDYENGKYIISAQILDLKKDQKEGNSSAALLYKSEGKTIGDAIRNIGLTYPKTLYLGHLQLLVIGKGEIKHGINNSFDYLIRTIESRNDATMVITTKNSAYEILNPNDEEKEQMPVDDIITTLKNSMDRNGKAVVVNLEEFITIYIEEGIDPVITEIALTNNDTNKEYKDTTLLGISVFKHNKYISLLDDDSSIAYNILNNNFYDVSIDTIYNNDIVELALFNPKSKIDLELNDNKINVNININSEGHVLDIKPNVSLTKDKVLDELEKSSNKVIENYINKLIDYSKENDVDIIGLKNMIYKNYYKEYTKYKNINIYKIANIKIKSNISIYRYGSIHKGFSETGDNNE